MDYFKGLIKCSYCSKNFNFKSNNGVQQFICSSVKNYGRSNCPNSPYINLDFLLEIIERHCNLNNKDWDITKAKLFLSNIEIGDELIIRWKNGQVSKISPTEAIF